VHKAGALVAERPVAAAKVVRAVRKVARRVAAARKAAARVQVRRAAHPAAARQR
jgi:hypothetical protein